jgi:DNA polymerase-1
LNADITKLAMGRLYHRLSPFNARLINVVHDELVFEVPQEDAEEATGIIRDEMEAAGRDYLSSVPVVVEVNAGEAWGCTALPPLFCSIRSCGWWK